MPAGLALPGGGIVASLTGRAAKDRASRHHASDRAIAERVLQALFPDLLLRRQRVEVAVVAGKVTLGGTAATAQERAAAERVARGVDGVEGALSG